MSAYIRPNVFVRIEQADGKFAPRPLPLENGFSNDRDYEILGLHCPSESGEAYCILRNDRDEIWFISNRHLRVARTVELNLKDFTESHPMQKHLL